MRYRTFVTYNIIGALLWGVGVTLLGFWLGQFAFVQEYLEPILIAIVLVSVIPVVVELLRARKNGRAARSVGTEDAEAEDSVEETPDLAGEQPR
jgi:membrane-associated protein